MGVEVEEGQSIAMTPGHGGKRNGRKVDRDIEREIQGTKLWIYDSGFCDSCAMTIFVPDCVAVAPRQRYLCISSTAKTFPSSVL